MSDTWKKFKLLTWKNFRLAVRHPFLSIIDLCFPVAIVGILVTLRSFLGANFIQETSFTEFSPTDSHKLRQYKLFFSPNTSTAVGKLMYTVVNKAFKCGTNCEPMIGFETQEDLEAGVSVVQWKEKIGIVFPDSYKGKHTLPSRIEYTLRFPSELRHYKSSVTIVTWMTDLLFPTVQTSGTRSTDQKETALPGYYKENFLALQSYVSEAIIEAKSSTPLKDTEIALRRFPYPAYYDDKLMPHLQNTMGFVMVVAFSFTVISLLKVIVMEKEKQLLESMKIMGLPGHLHWNAWLFKQMIFLIVSCIGVVILFKINCHISPIFPHSNPYLIFTLLFLYALATVTLCFAISVCFWRAKMACTIGLIIFFALSLPYIALNRTAGISWAMKLVACLSSNTAIAYGFQLLIAYETSGFGIHWINIFEPVTPNENLTIAQIYLMLTIDTVLHMLFSIYIESVFPGRYGVGKKWNYVFTWMRRKKRDISANQPEEEITRDPTRYEEDPVHLEVGIDIRGLSKKIGREILAVNNLHLKMYEDQVTVLLGHNGSGRTTTIALLTGMMKPSSGTAIINNYDVTTQIQQVRSSLGLCPENNILFDELTVSDHIYFYTRLKGITDEGYIKSEIRTYLRLLDLTESRNKKTSILSDGMKRKLSIAIAFCGGSKIVILDEPTAGMDANTRPGVRDFVLSQKKGRTIMVTSRFMDEAEVLGDRIALISRGVLQCCGSCPFLKKNYGAGYYLNVEMMPDADEQEITESIQKQIPDAHFDSSYDTTLTYQLNDEDVPKFEIMLADLESNMETLKITRFGIFVTTLEELFLRSGSYTTVVKRDQGRLRLLSLLPREKIDISIHSRRKGFGLICNQAKAMLLKRYLNTKRNWLRLFVQILAPLLGIMFGFISKHTSLLGELPNMPISLNKYVKPRVLLQHSGNPPLHKAAQKWLKSLEMFYQEVPNIQEFILRRTLEKPGLLRMRYLIGAEINETKVVGWFNNIPYHTPPLALNFIYNSMIKSINYEYNIKLNNHPLPLSSKNTFYLWGRVGTTGFEIACCMGICMGFTFALFIVFYIHERMCKIKHLQFVSGIKTYLFWTISLIWDWLIYLGVVAIILLIIFLFQEDGFRTEDEMLRLFIILMYFGYAMLPYVVVMSFCFTSPASGFTYSWVVAFIGYIMFFTVWISSQQQFRSENIVIYLDWAFLPCPIYALMAGINNAYLEHQRMVLCRNNVDHCVSSKSLNESECWKQLSQAQEECWPDYPEYFIWNERGILRNIAVSFLVGTFMLFMLVVIESRVFPRLKYACTRRPQYGELGHHWDPDVQAENQRIRAINESRRRKYKFIASNLTKKFGKFKPVNGVFFSVSEKECFGLLGMNGAGKTTTLRMITGDLSITSGNVYIEGINLKYHRQMVFKNIGYCPQLDALFEDLTAHETIKIFALLRGYKLVECNHVVEKLASEFEFTPQLNKYIRDLTAGLKRKVSISIALLGDPSIIFLDEPTIGLDPETKRNLWNTLCRLRENGKAFIIGTHSMEETQALCTRIAIMVNGQFNCLGSTEYLKNKFERGFSLVVRLLKNVDREVASNDVIDFVFLHFPATRIQEKQPHMIKFYIPNTEFPWSEMFGIMEMARESLPIADYSLGQATFEQAFVKFSKQQH